MPKDEFDPEDPWELTGAAVSLEGGAGLREMARCLVEEYLRMGYGQEELMGFFRDPFYRSTHALYGALGEEGVRGVVGEVFEEWMSAGGGGEGEEGGEGDAPGL